MARSAWNPIRKDPSRRNGVKAFFVTLFTRELGFSLIWQLTRNLGRYTRLNTFDHTVPYGTDLFNRRFQALRARLPSECPSGTIERLALADATLQKISWKSSWTLCPWALHRSNREKFSSNCSSSPRLSRLCCSSNLPSRNLRPSILLSS
jgi:hypothetical protein